VRDAHHALHGLVQVTIRPLLLNSEDSRGGAARAASRLHQGLRRIGVDARMLVQIKHGDDAWVAGPKTVIGKVLNRLRPAMDLLPVLAYPHRTEGVYYPGWLPDGIPSRVQELDPTVVHLHWITGGFLNVRSLKRLQLPLVWTLHDMWAFTGGCHYDEGCGRYRQRCGSCPVLASNTRYDLSWLSWCRKRRAYRTLQLQVVAPSRWLAQEARTSQLLGGFPVHVIPNGLDLDQYRPVDRGRARELLGLPSDRKLILFEAMTATGDPRKGFSHLRPALARLAAGWRGQGLTAVVFGASTPAQPPDLGMPSVYMGTLGDDVALALLYSAADVYVAPSLQENLSNTVMEVLACGTSCVAFDVGGMPDMVEHRRNGYLARAFEAADLAAGIRWVIEDEARWRELSARARAKIVEEFELEWVARRHLDLYREVLGCASQPAA
jgi:glycosyltransferase involved in cell wall biosynthesis